MTALASCAFLIVSASKAIPNLFVSARVTPLYTALPLNDLSDDGSATDTDAKDTPAPRYQGKVRITVLAVAISALSVRLELYRQINKKTECTVSSLEIFLPLLLACYDALRFQKNELVEVSERPDESTYRVALKNLKRSILEQRFRYVLPAAALCFGCRVLLKQRLAVNSTYICPVVLRQQTTIPSMQTACLLLDLLLAIIVYEMLPRSNGYGLSPRRSVVFWTSTLTGTSIVWSIAGVIVYLVKPEFRFWLLLLDSPRFLELLISLSLQSLLFSIFCITTLHSVSCFLISRNSADPPR